MSDDWWLMSDGSLQVVTVKLLVNEYGWKPSWDWPWSRWICLVRDCLFLNLN